MPLTEQDSAYLEQALALAGQAVGRSSPNPSVGALVVDSRGRVAGTGFHTYDGVLHAEILALKEAGERASDGTLYINLEPCSHHGRTGPCADALIAAGISRVVACMLDPNPKVSGEGLNRLHAAGIEVEIAEGRLNREARKLNEAFAHYILHGRPLVTLKAAMTLDGKIAPPPGETSEVSTALGAAGASGGHITSEEARAHVQQLRHASDAIMVGVGTVIADDPLLTDRTGLPRRRRLLRVIFDSRLRLPLSSRLASSADDDVIVFCAFAEEGRKRELEKRGIRVEQIPLFPDSELSIVGGRPMRSASGRPDIRKLVGRLGELEITSLMIEGGALINWAALSAGVVDKVFLYYAPKILAGGGAVPFASGEGFRHMMEAAYVKSVAIHHFGEDFAVEGYLRDPYEPPQTSSVIEMIK
jgi:diaminohydroxyphosphoribosylaminopyrimidine deaminase/5-amino-6-(5-phosphoribosylamino)uracil reductase